MCACMCCTVDIMFIRGECVHTVDIMFIRGEYVCMYVLHSRYHVYKG